MIKFLLIFTGLISLYLVLKNKIFSHKKNKLNNFKNKFNNTEAKIEKIFLRNNERLVKDPNIDLIIGLHEKEIDFTLINIHRARLAKFKKSKLNGEFIYQDLKGNIYKIINERKEYI